MPRYPKPRSKITAAVIVLAALFLLNCNTWTPLPQQPDAPVLQTAIPTQIAGLQSNATVPAPFIVPTLTDTPASPGAAIPVYAGAGEPAGCLSADEQAGMRSSQMLAYAERLAGLPQSLSHRKLSDSWNNYAGRNMAGTEGVISLGVDNVENKYLVQRLMNALQVAGYVTWLRRTPYQQEHILAIPLADPAVLQSSWAPYIQAYWESRASAPSGDPYTLPALKLPPCAWMVSRGFAPQVDASWWAADPTGWPDYAAPAAAFLADTSRDATRIARQINWLGNGGLEAPDGMCGPLSWEILNAAGVFPPGWGGWREGPRAFWLAKPTLNGRPWNLFPADQYQVNRFSQPLGSFDFSTFPLYPGDFLYTYSRLDGFDHMLVVTEVDGSGNVYTVTNLIQEEPEKKVSIQRVLLLNLHDPAVGIARNQWARDRVNGRTGHAGFDVFRWAWMQKDIDGQPASYIVQPGDTPGLIAARWRTPVTRIAEYNGIKSDSPLTVGQVLRIPPNENIGR